MCFDPIYEDGAFACRKCAVDPAIVGNDEASDAQKLFAFWAKKAGVSVDEWVKHPSDYYTYDDDDKRE